MVSEAEARNIISNEIVVDCYDAIEISLGWYYYLEEKLEFPFQATARLKKSGGKIVREKVTVSGIASSEDGLINKDLRLNLEVGGYILDISYSKLSNVVASDETKEALALWDYWTKDKR